MNTEAVSDNPEPAPGAAAADVLAALRAATGERHAVVDHAMPLSQAQPGLEQYREHLLLLLRWLGPIENWLGQFHDGPQDPALLPPLSHARRAAADLEHPALPGGAAALRSMPAAEPGAKPGAKPGTWAAEQDPAYRWGVCYVIEGSQLGGAVMYRALAQRLAPHPLHYLQGEDGAAGPGPRWQRFVRALRAAVVQPAAVAQACRGAADAFDALLRQLPAA